MLIRAYCIFVIELTVECVELCKLLRYLIVSAYDDGVDESLLCEQGNLLVFCLLSRETFSGMRHEMHSSISTPTGTLP